MLKKYAPIDKIYVRAQGSDKTRGILQAGNLRLPCIFGYSGISAFKREGDGATPRVKMRITGGFRKSRQSLLPRCGLFLRRARPHDGWCDAPADPNYNRLVRLPYKGSAETLNRADSLYNIAFVLDWNMQPRIKGRGSAIFLHIARAKTQIAVEGKAVKNRKSHAASLFHPTAGCIAIAERDMRRLMPFLHKNTAIIVTG